MNLKNDMVLVCEQCGRGRGRERLRRNRRKSILKISLIASRQTIKFKYKHVKTSVLFSNLLYRQAMICIIVVVNFDNIFYSQAERAAEK